MDELQKQIALRQALAAELGDNRIQIHSLNIEIAALRQALAIAEGKVVPLHAEPAAPTPD